jgi:predicted RNase H-like HicB family nuclease
LAGVQFEIEVHEDDAGAWVATAVHYQVTATGRTETEALARLMEALALHFERASR